MFEKEIFQLIKQVVTSWQVIVVTIALILYLNIVFSAAKAYRLPKMGKITLKKKKKKETVEVTPDVSDEEGDVNEDLGLEEA